MRIAILDFGTNTFNLLIAEDEKKDQLYLLHTSKQGVKLGKGGIINNVLQPEAIKRGLQAISEHYKTIESYQAEKVYAYATSAIRDAKNSPEFLKKVKEQFNLYVNVIPGDREAELIYKGVRQACSFCDDKVLILDIGGGSNECIIADKNRIYWKKSYNLGMARLLEKFKPSDPLTHNELIEIEFYLEKELRVLFNMVNKYHPKLLIGASGSFETFHAVIEKLLPEKYKDSPDHFKEIFLEDYRGLHGNFLRSTLAERKNMPGMEPVRVEMIVLASIFVNFILKKGEFEKMMLSQFALKEGVLAETLNI